MTELDNDISKGRNDSNDNGGQGHENATVMVLTGIFGWSDGIFLAGSRDDFAATVSERVALVTLFAGGKCSSGDFLATIGGRVKVVASLATFGSCGGGGLDAVAGAGINYFALFATLEGLVDIGSGRRGVVSTLSAIGAERSIRSTALLFFVVAGGGDGLLCCVNDFELERLGGALG